MWTEIKRAKNPTAAVGYTAFYSPFVHENMEAKHTKLDIKSGESRQIGQAKFLESALKDSEKDVLRILKNEVKIKR